MGVQVNAVRVDDAFLFDVKRRTLVFMRVRDAYLLDVKGRDECWVLVKIPLQSLQYVHFALATQVIRYSARDQ